MAALYSTTKLKLFFLHSKTKIIRTAVRQFTLLNAKQQKKKASKVKAVENLVQKPKGSEKVRERGVKSDLSTEHLINNLDVFDSAKSANGASLFKDILRDRYNQAKRSVVIRTQNPESTIQSLLTFGNLKHAQFTSQDKAYILAEFTNEATVARLQQTAGFFTEPNQFPMRTRVMFDISSRPQRKHRPLPQIDEVNWSDKSSKTYPVMAELQQEVESLCARRSIDDRDLRSRFFVCLQLEEMLQSVLPEAYVLPFGSCLNGFGWWDSDLDMMLCFSKELCSTQVTVTQNGRSSDFRMLTETFSSSRLLAQSTLSMVASLLQLTPRVHHVSKILNARVPIIRFKNMAVSLDCDISLQAMDSIKMTELLYLYSVCDPRVKPLMTVIKQWAICHHLTAGGEQQKPTTIGMLFMLLHYLQTRSPQVVPTLKTLQSYASTTDMFYIDDTVYGLPSKPSLIPRSQNKETIDTLLHGFFTFYSEFDFKNKAISVIEGCTFAKPADATPVYIENPLSNGLNICRNVGGTQLKHFITAMKDAASKLETLNVKPGKSPVSRLSVLFSTNQDSQNLEPVQISQLFPEVEDNSIDLVNNQSNVA
ncbi:hypothetical protein BsWGS_25769 [Bradybaena similaris]